MVSLKNRIESIGIYGIGNIYSNHNATLVDPFLRCLKTSGLEVHNIDPFNSSIPVCLDVLYVFSQENIDYIYMIKARTGCKIIICIDEPITIAVENPLPRLTGDAYFSFQSNNDGEKGVTYVPAPFDFTELLRLPRNRANNQIFRVLSVAPLIWESGIEFTIDAVAKTRDAGIDVRYTIIGKGPYSDAIIYTARQWGLLGDIVKIIESAPSNQFLLNTDVVIHTPYYDQFAPIMYEAMALAVPIIVSDTKNKSCLIQDGDTGIIVPPHNPEAITNSLIRLARDLGLQERLGQAAKNILLAEFDPADTTGILIDLYRRIDQHLLVSTKREGQ